MLNIFSRLAAGEEMPVREKIRVQRGRTAAHRRRRARWHPCWSTALPQARQRYPRLGWQQAMLLLWVVISAALVAVALVLNTSSHKAADPAYLDVSIVTAAGVRPTASAGAPSRFRSVSAGAEARPW